MASFPIKPSVAASGCAVGAVAFVLLDVLIPSIWPVLGVYAGVVVLAYVIGSFTIGDGTGEFLRGLLIGTNAAVNWSIAMLLFPKLFGEAAGTLLAVGAGVIPLLSTFGALSTSPVYQGFLGYLNWLLPLSWPIVALGFGFFFVTVLGAVIGLFGAKYFQITKAVFDWKTGTMFLRGGWVSNLNPIDTAFNMGNFAFVDADFDEKDMAIDHESGHTLNLAAFGSLFHLIGAIDENALRGENALSECLAESHVPDSNRPILAMWA